MVPRVAGRRASKCPRAVGRRWKVSERRAMRDGVSGNPSTSTHQFDVEMSCSSTVEVWFVPDFISVVLSQASVAQKLLYPIVSSTPVFRGRCLHALFLKSSVEPSWAATILYDILRMRHYDGFNSGGCRFLHRWQTNPRGTCHISS